MKNTEELRACRRRIGNNIREVRVGQNLTMRHLAKQTGVSITTLDCYEMGKKFVNLEMLAVIAQALKVPMNRLFE